MVGDEFIAFEARDSGAMLVTGHSTLMSCSLTLLVVFYYWLLVFRRLSFRVLRFCSFVVTILAAAGFGFDWIGPTNV
jgi:hypothetical protein